MAGSMEEYAVYVAVEDDPGTAETVAAADAMAFRACDLNEDGGPVAVQAIVPRAVNRPRRAGVINIVRGSLEWDIFAHAAAGDNFPKQDRLWAAGGFTATQVVSTSLTYEPDSVQTVLPGATPTYPPVAGTERYSLTIQKTTQPVAQGNHWKASGCRLSGPVLTGTPEGIIAKANFVGAYEDVAAAAALVDPSSELESGPVFDTMDIAGTPFSFHGNSGLVLEQWTLDPGLAPKLRRSPNGRYGHAWPPYVERANAGQLTLLIEAVDETTFGAHARWLGATAGQVSLVYKSGARTMTVNVYDSVITAIQKQVGVPLKYNVTLAPSWDPASSNKNHMDVVLT